MSLDDRLINWGRWARGGLKLGHCGSVEGRYRSNWRQWCSLADIPSSIAIDPLDAVCVENAWSNMAEHKEKKILKLVYIYRLDNSKAMQRARIRTLDQFSATHARARNLLVVLLDKQKDLCLNISKSNCSPNGLKREEAPSGPLLL